jgi:hypothetical protein
MATACSKPPAPTNGDASANAPPNAMAAVAAPDAVSPSPAATENAKHFHVIYTIVPGTLYVPAGVKFKNDPSRMLGEGTLTLTVDAGGRISGGSEGGPLGNTIIEGTANEGTFLATIRRKDPSDKGLTGTLTLTPEGSKLRGTMKLSESNAEVVREATITAQAEAAGQGKH